MTDGEGPVKLTKEQAKAERQQRRIQAGDPADKTIAEVELDEPAESKDEP